MLLSALAARNRSEIWRYNSCSHSALFDSISSCYWPPHRTTTFDELGLVQPFFFFLFHFFYLSLSLFRNPSILPCMVVAFPSLTLRGRLACKCREKLFAISPMHRYPVLVFFACFQEIWRTMSNRLSDHLYWLGRPIAKHRCLPSFTIPLPLYPLALLGPILSPIIPSLLVYRSVSFPCH